MIPSSFEKTIQRQVKLHLIFEFWSFNWVALLLFKSEKYEVPKVFLLNLTVTLWGKFKARFANKGTIQPHVLKLQWVHSTRSIHTYAKLKFKIFSAPGIFFSTSTIMTILMKNKKVRFLPNLGAFKGLFGIS